MKCPVITAMEAKTCPAMFFQISLARRQRRAVSSGVGAHEVPARVGHDDGKRGRGRVPGGGRRVGRGVVVAMF